MFSTNFVAEPDMFSKYEEAEEICLRAYQDESIEALRANIREGIKTQVLASMVGSGKTIMAAFLIREAWRKGVPSCFVVDRLSLLGQTSDVFDRYGIPHGVVQSSHPRRRPGELVQIASIQTVKQRGWPKARLVICDECFSGDTIIETPSGGMRIDSIAAGQLVYNACGVSQVASVFRKQTNETITLHLSNGQDIECTADHPFFTESGWKEAATLERGQRLFSREAVRNLWRRSEAGIQSEQRASGDGIHIQKAEILRAILRQESREPDALSQDTKEDVCNASEDWPQAEGARREWARNDSAAGNALQSNRERVASGGRDSNGMLQGGERHAATLQNRPSECGEEGRRGSGRKQPLLANEARAGFEERCVSEEIRLEGITHHEQGSGVAVFNLRIEGHPSYFAGGVLVHNCHIIHSAMKDRILNNDGAVIIGLSATPFTKGLGKFYGGIVNVTTGNKLTEEKFLVPFKVWAAHEPDMTGAKVVAGEWTDNAASERATKIIGNVVDEYQRRGEDRKTICFGVDVKHCEAMQMQFLKAGIRAELYTYLTGDEERDIMLREFRKPDSSIKILISVAALSRGFDVPDVGCIIYCRPLKSSLAEFIQILGRGLRSHPSKKDCIILDLAGNFMRHHSALMEFMENGVNELCDGKPKPESESKKRAEKPPVKCPKCSYLPVKGAFCESCGYEFPRRSEVVHEPGELGEFKLATNVRKWTMEEKAQLFAELKHYAITRKWKQYRDGAVFKAIVGTYPNSFRDVKPIPPSAETLALIDAEAEKYRKSIARKSWQKVVSAKPRNVVKEPDLFA